MNKKKKRFKKPVWWISVPWNYKPKSGHIGVAIDGMLLYERKKDKKRATKSILVKEV